MQHQRAQNILANQSRVAQRVFKFVPMQEFWSADQILAEMKRVESTTPSIKELLGILEALVESGLVNETASTTFRSAVKPAKEKVAMIQTDAVEVSKELTLSQRLLARAVETRATAKALMDSADELEMLALELEETIKAAAEGGDKFNKLQATLKQLLN